MAELDPAIQISCRADARLLDGRLEAAHG